MGQEFMNIEEESKATTKYIFYGKHSCKIVLLNTWESIHECLY